MSFDSFEWMLTVTLLSMAILFIIFKSANEVVISADIRPASMQIIFLLIVAPFVSLIIFASSESWKNVENYKALVTSEQKAYPELFASYQTLLDSVVRCNDDNRDAIKMLNYKKLDNYRNAVVNYQAVYMGKNYSFAAFYPTLTKNIDQIEIDILNKHFKDAEIKLKEAHEQLLNVRNSYLSDLEEGQILAETKLWLLVGLLEFVSVFLLAWGIWFALVILYTDKILVDIYKKLLEIEQILSVPDRKIYLKIRYIMGIKYLVFRTLRLFLILNQVYKIIQTQNRLNCLSDEYVMKLKSKYLS